MLVTWQEFTAGGRPQGGSIPEDLRDFIENVSAKDRPALALFRKSRVGTTFVEWQEDTLPARAHNAFVEGVGESDMDLQTPVRLFAHVQNFARWGRVSDVQRAVEHKGFADAYLYQEKKSIDATLNDIEHAIHRGSSVTGATSAARQFQGLLNILTTSSNFTALSGVTLTESIFSDLVQRFVDNNTEIRPNVCFVNSLLKRRISSFSTNVTRNVNANERLQENVIERHSSDFGDVDIFYTRDQLKSATKGGVGNSLVLLDPSFFEVGFLQSLMSEQLARNGLRTSFQISAMCTLIYRTALAIGGTNNLASGLD